MRKSLVGTLFVVVALGGCTKPGPSPTVAPPPTDTAATPTDTAAPASTGTAAVTPAPQKASMVDMQKAAMKEREAAWAAHDVGRLMALYAPEAKIGSVTPAGWTDSGLSDTKEDLQAMMTAFPDSKLAVTRIISTAEKATVEWVLTGTNTGDFLGVKGTGKPFGIKGASFIVLNKDGKLVRENMYFDVPTIRAQIAEKPGAAKVRPIEPAPAKPAEIFVAAPGEEPKSAAVLKKFYERSQMRDHAGMTGLLADDVVLSNSYEAADMTKQDVAKALPGRDKAFVNPAAVVKQCVSAGEYAACEYEWTATFKGAAMGKAPTGKTGTKHEFDVVRVKDGKLAYVNGYGNMMEFDIAFGLVAPKPRTAPPPPPPPPPPKGDAKAPPPPPPPPKGDAKAPPPPPPPPPKGDAKAPPPPPPPPTAAPTATPKTDPKTPPPPPNK